MTPCSILLFHEKKYFNKNHRAGHNREPAKGGFPMGLLLVYAAHRNKMFRKQIFNGLSVWLID